MSIFGSAIGAAIGGAIKAGTTAAKEVSKKKGSSSSGSNKSNSNSSSNGYGKVDPGKSAKNVDTFTSYNGGFLNVDLNTDYTRLMQDSAKRGDYTSAAKYEAMRNAKVNHLNSLGGTKYSVSNNYVRDYGYSNNKGGKIYESIYKNVSSLPDNWSDVTVNGARYTKDAQGNIYEVGRNYDDGSAGSLRKVGTGINANTGEFTFDNYNDARAYAYDNYVRSNSGLGQYGEDAYTYIDNKGLVDQEYVNAIMNGTNAQYTQAVADRAKLEKKQRQRMAMFPEDYYEEEGNNNGGNVSGNQHTNTPISQEQQAVLDENSFETDGIGLDNDFYLQQKINSLRGGRKKIY